MFKVLKTEGAARRGEFSCPHGTVQTPVFMNVGTQAAIFGAGLLTGLVCLASSYYQSKVCANGIAAIGNGHDVMGKTLILAAFPELYAILTVAAVFLIAGAI